MLHLLKLRLLIESDSLSQLSPISVQRFDRTTDIEQIVYLGRYLMTVVVTPDRHEDDSNALLVRPVGLIPFSFGADSSRLHCVLAEKAGATVHIYRSERIALDIDTPKDLADYQQRVGRQRAAA